MIDPATPGFVAHFTKRRTFNMYQNDKTLNFIPPRKLGLNLAIVGGGQTCKFFLGLLQDGAFPYLHINLVGVCDTDPEAEGLVMAQEMGIFTTHNYLDLFELGDLDFVLELTNNDDVFLDLLRLRPKGVGVMEHNIGRLLRSLFSADRKLKSAEQQMLLAKMSSDYLIQNSTSRILVLKPNFRIIDVNETYLKALGKTREEVIGAYCYEINYGLKAPCTYSQPELACPVLETLRTGKTAHAIHEHTGPDNEPVYSNINSNPLKDREGNILRVILTRRNITRELQATYEKRVQELMADSKKLVQEDRMISLGKLAASCVHEINNPIQGLMTFSHLMQEILKDGALGDEDLENFKSYLHIMSDELERCGNIVSGLLSFSRQSPMEFKLIDLADVLEAVIELTRHKMQLQDIQLKIHLIPELFIRGDTTQLQQCFLNLIFNAIEAMPLGGQMDISSRSDRAKDTAVVEIRDTGSGIPEEDIDHIFDPFFTTKQDGEGTGLGLSIVYGITKTHEGHIQVESKEGRGSAFILQFPLKDLREEYRE